MPTGLDCKQHVTAAKERERNSKHRRGLDRSKVNSALDLPAVRETTVPD